MEAVKVPDAINPNKFMYMAESKALWEGPMIAHRLCNMKSIWVEVASLAITSWVKGDCQEWDNNLVVDTMNFWVKVVTSTSYIKRGLLVTHWLAKCTKLSRSFDGQCRIFLVILLNCKATHQVQTLYCEEVGALQGFAADKVGKWKI